MNIALLLQYAAVLPLKGKDYKVLLYLLPRMKIVRAHVCRYASV